jgi:FAD synthase
MKIFTDMNALPPFFRAVVTVGSFDGVHRGHRFLLDVLRRRAQQIEGETVVVTFDEHPRRVLGTAGEMMVLTSTDEKARLIAEAGIDNLVVLPFDAGVAGLSADDFVRDFLVARIGVRELVVGYNHRLGRGREGDADVLGVLGEKYGFSVHRAPKFEGVGLENSDFLSGDPSKKGGGDEKISSTAIRAAIARGDLATAERMLGRKL